MDQSGGGSGSNPNPSNPNTDSLLINEDNCKAF